MVEFASSLTLKRGHAVERVVYEDAQRPEVDFFVVLADDHFRRQVDGSAHGLVVRPSGDAAGESEVDELETGYVVSLSKHDILDLHVAVYDPDLVTVVQRGQQLLHDDSEAFFVDLVLAHEVNKGAGAVPGHSKLLLHKEEVLFVLVHFQQLDDVGVVQADQIVNFVFELRVVTRRKLFHELDSDDLVWVSRRYRSLCCAPS